MTNLRLSIRTIQQLELVRHSIGCHGVRLCHQTKKSKDNYHRQRRLRRRHYSSSSDNILVYDKQFINGSFVPSSSSTFLTVSDSNTGQPYASVIRGTAQDMEHAIQAASRALPGWSSLPLEQRKDYVRALLASFLQRKDTMAQHLQHELGAPYKFAKHVQCSMFDMHLKEYLKVVDEYEWTLEDAIQNTILCKEPIGVVGAITPWNWPLNAIVIKMIPALLSGCTIVLKPSEVTPINAYLLSEAVEEANFPPGVYNMVCGTGSETASLFRKHPLVDMISFTGSTAIGATLVSTVQQRVRTELGGKSAAIVLDDAPEDRIRMILSDVLENSGQTCSALTRLVVPQQRLEEINAIVKDVFESNCRVVDATDPTATPHDMGPLSSKSHWERVRNYIQIGMEQDGATLLTGGLEFPENVHPHGYFVRPTAFTNVTNDMTIAREEIFGPVLSILSYDTIEQAIEIANDTNYGLNNAIIGGDDDERRMVQLAKQLKSGQVQINTRHPTSFLRVPFGGYKQSGDGREHGIYGLEEYLQIKAINLPRYKKR